MKIKFDLEAIVEIQRKQNDLFEKLLDSKRLLEMLACSQRIPSDIQDEIYGHLRGYDEL